MTTQLLREFPHDSIEAWFSQLNKSTAVSIDQKGRVAFGKNITPDAMTKFNFENSSVLRGIAVQWMLKALELVNLNAGHTTQEDAFDEVWIAGQILDKHLKSGFIRQYWAGDDGRFSVDIDKWAYESKYEEDEDEDEDDEG